MSAILDTPVVDVVARGAVTVREEATLLVAARHLRGQGGAIINIGSVLSNRAIPLQGPYCAMKAAVMQFTDTLRMELEQEGAPISVTLVKPAAIDGELELRARVVDASARRATVSCRVLQAGEERAVAEVVAVRIRSGSEA